MRGPLPVSACFPPSGGVGERSVSEYRRHRFLGRPWPLSPIAAFGTHSGEARAERVPQHRLADERGEPGGGQASGRGAADVVGEVLFVDSAVEVVDAVVQRELRDLQAEHAGSQVPGQVGQRCWRVSRSCIRRASLEKQHVMVAGRGGRRARGRGRPGRGPSGVAWSGHAASMIATSHAVFPADALSRRYDSCAVQAPSASRSPGRHRGQDRRWAAPA
jgi:hypothetical protein